MKQKIIAELQKIEQAYDVKIIYACESGSRAWGFPSQDSDFDVRFLYLHRQDWYLSINIERKRDVIELPINNALDINGWDLRKALKLFFKSNPPLLEWLGSPIVYWEPFTIAQKMRELAKSFYKPTACMYHYLHMAQNNNRDYVKGDQVWLKKYFYILRPLLAINWLERDLGVVPTEFEQLVAQVVDSEALREKIRALIQAKKNGQELDYGPRIPEISNFIDNKLTRLKGEKFKSKIEKQPIFPLNGLFRSALNEVWEGRVY